MMEKHDIAESDGAPRTIILEKQPDDPVCMRISIGGEADKGYYVVYRGELPKIKLLLKSIVERLEAVDSEAAIGQGVQIFP